MAYTPTQGLFVNGRVADADEILNEFGAISGAINDVASEVESTALNTENTVKKYTDDKLAQLSIDGGTF